MPTPPKLALAQLMALDLSPPEMVRLAAGAGCQAAGIRLERARRAVARTHELLARAATEQVP